MFENEAWIEVDNADDVEEVTNYLRAFRYVRENLQAEGGLPISVRLICEAHRLLLDGVRGAGKEPGELRRSQDWIGGKRPGTPPSFRRHRSAWPSCWPTWSASSTSKVASCRLSSKSRWLTRNSKPAPRFLDGNGRMGRLLISALLEHWSLMQTPLLYISGYLERHQAEYYRMLSNTRTDGDCEAWIAFFLDGVASAAAQAERTIIELATLVANDRRQLLEPIKAGAIAYRLFESLTIMPRFTAEQAKQRLATTYPTANAALRALAEARVVREMTALEKKPEPRLPVICNKPDLI